MNSQRIVRRISSRRRCRPIEPGYGLLPEYLQDAVGPRVVRAISWGMPLASDMLENSKSRLGKKQPMEMKSSALKYFNPRRWVRQFMRLLAQWEAHRVGTRVREEFLCQHGRSGGHGPRAIIAEGLWDNPNHWFRLRMFLRAIPDTDDCRLIGILRTEKDVEQRKWLESLGFNEFIYIDQPSSCDEKFSRQAEALIAGARTHADMLKIALPFGLPAYVFYDTVLKRARHPRPKLDSPLWFECLVDVLRYIEIYKKLFDDNEIYIVITSHGWKSEYAALVWQAICHKVPAYHLTAYTEGIRIRRYDNRDDYRTPVEHMQYERGFLALPENVQQRISDDGQAYLEEVVKGTFNDINMRYANRPDLRISNRDEARQALRIPDNKPLAVIYAHAWFDFPHVFGMNNFVDLVDWIEVTVAEAKMNTEVHWLFKPHPMEKWYGGFHLADIVDDTCPNISVCPIDTDTVTIQNASDIAITVHGTVGIEAASKGVVTICADHNYYNDWGFSYSAKSREHYCQMLATVQSLAKPSEEQRRLAMAVAALHFAPPAETGLLRTMCDSTPRKILYDYISQTLKNNQVIVDRETDKIQQWLSSGHSSYSLYNFLRHHGAI